MYSPRPRVIPCLLLDGAGLVKTVRFGDRTYLGDPRNVVKIFNDKEVDEICLLDIRASKERRGPNFDLIREIANEAFMPLGYGGGIRTADEARRVIALGVEKVVLNTAALDDLAIVTACAHQLGSQSVVVSIDVKTRRFSGRKEVYSHAAGSFAGKTPAEFARAARDAGAGEILLNSVDRDGAWSGYDLPLVRSVSAAVDIPVIACGGARGLQDFGDVVREGGAAAAAAGSFFVFHGRLRAVLVTFPKAAELAALFEEVRTA